MNRESEIILDLISDLILSNAEEGEAEVTFSEIEPPASEKRAK